MSIASSNLGKAIIVLVVVLVSVIIFTNKLRMSALPFLDWNNKESLDKDNYVSSSLKLADDKLSIIEDSVKDEDKGNLNLKLTKEKLFVYYGIYNGEYYRLTFKQNDPKLKLGEKYSLIKDKGVIFIKISDKKKKVDLVSNSKILFYDAHFFYKMNPKSFLMYCGKDEFCISAKVINDKKYYFSHYIENKELECKVYYKEIVFLSQNNKPFENINKVESCNDVLMSAHDVFEKLAEDISHKKEIRLDILNKVNTKFLFVLGLYYNRDSGKIQNVLIFYSLQDYDPSILIRKLVDDNRYEDFCLMYYHEPYFDNIEDISLKVLDQFDFNVDFVILPNFYDSDAFSKFKNYLLSCGENKVRFIPIVYFFHYSKDTSNVILINRPYVDGFFNFNYLIYNVNDKNFLDFYCKTINDHNYCILS